MEPLLQILFIKCPSTKSIIPIVISLVVMLSIVSVSVILIAILFFFSFTSNSIEPQQSSSHNEISVITTEMKSLQRSMTLGSQPFVLHEYLQTTSGLGTFDKMIFLLSLRSGEIVQMKPPKQRILELYRLFFYSIISSRRNIYWVHKSLYSC